VLSSVGKRASHSQRKEEREAPSVWSGVKLVGGGGGEGRPMGGICSVPKSTTPFHFSK